MPRTSLIDMKSVAKYCFEPRKIRDICVQFSMGSPQAHRTMNKLVWANLVAERMMKGRGMQYKLFLRSDLDNESEWERREPFTNAIPAHDPFGLTYKLALELADKGVSVKNFTTKYTRKIRLLDIESKRIGGRQFWEEKNELV